MVETRVPKKGQGVPKETPGSNSIADLEGILTEHFPEVQWDGLRTELDSRDFFGAGMQQQVRILAEASATVLGDRHATADLIPTLAASPVEKIRGVAAFTVPIAYRDDLEAQLQDLRFTGALEGTWPRELSATVLHNLIIQHGVATMLPRVQAWIEDPEPAIRRLVVEATRPRGVMLAHITELKENPAPLRAILEPLLDDDADYVRKAVANNLNDVSRDNPAVVLAWTREWMTPDASPERRWVLSRALRTLVNEGDPDALAILGYTPASALDVVWRDTTPHSVQINELLPFEFDIHNPTDAEAFVILLLMMDEPGKGQGRRKSRYQIWKGRVRAGGSKGVSKRIHFVDKSTQRKEPGTYRLSITVNGQVLEERTMLFQR
jgi:3-methyladenine DNA glycosylase AlkC